MSQTSPPATPRSRGCSNTHRGDDRRGTAARLSLALPAILALLAVPSTATAQDELPPGSGGVDQYVESLPGAGGGKPAGGSRGRKGAPLSARAQKQLRNTPEDRLLRRVASDPQLGAPERGGRGSNGRESAGGGAAPEGSIPAAVGDTFFKSGTGLPVLLGLVAIALIGGLGAYRRGLRRGRTRGVA